MDTKSSFQKNKVPLLDLTEQYQFLKKEMNEALSHVIESQHFILGPHVEACEKNIADYCGAGFGCGVSSGTDALIISLIAAGVGLGDEVITTPYSFFATAGSVHRVGAKPVFVDIDSRSYNIDVSKIEEKITSKTKVILPVHLYGQVADMTSLAAIAKKHNLIVIEDAAQAIGAEHQGKRAGSLGDYGCFSFFPSKNLGAFGDGGMVVTQSEKSNRQLKSLRNHGSQKKYYHDQVGGNFRLDAIQAAVINVKLKHLDNWTEKRIANAKNYAQLFQDMNLVKDHKIHVPQMTQDRHVFNQYVIRVLHKKRDELKQHLIEHGIGCEIYYPVPLHLQKCFKGLGYREGDFSESEKASQETLALPVFPELSPEAQAYVAETIKDFF